MKTFSIYLIAFLLLVLVCVVSLSIGRYPLSLNDLWLAISGAGSHEQRNTYSILLSLRLPRLIAALLVGATLSSAGAVYQVMFRNPLVSPDILGVSSGAGFGASLAILLGAGLVGVEFSAFGFGLLAVFLVYGISSRVKQLDSTLVLILMGVVISALFGSCISLMKILADPYTQLASITFWLMGGLNTVQLHELWVVLPLVVIAFIPLWLLRWRINILNLNDEEASSVGLPVKHLRLGLIIVATFMTSAVVSITGLIGWVGLIIPHIARLMVGAKFSHVLGLSLLLGPLFLLIADTASRLIAPIDLPLSILTSFMGVPFFVYLLLRKARRGSHA